MNVVNRCWRSAEDGAALLHSLDLWSDVVNLHAVLVGHHHVVCGPCVCPEDHPVLTNKHSQRGDEESRPLLEPLM